MRAQRQKPKPNLGDDSLLGRLTAENVAGEENFGSDIHTGRVGRVEPVDQAEVFGASRDNSNHCRGNEFASWLRGIN